MNSRLIGVLLGFSLSLHAFTLQSATLSVVPGTGNDCSDGEGSFQECLDIAENNGQGDTIEVQSGEYNLSATLSYVASVTENFPITVQNAGAELPVLSSGLTAQCLIFETGTLADDAAADVTVSGLVFQQCKNPGRTAAPWPSTPTRAISSSRERPSTKMSPVKTAAPST